MASKKQPKVTKDTAEKLAGAAYAFIHEHLMDAKAPMVHGIRGALERNDEHTISMAIMKLLVKDQNVAMAFTALCNHHACLRFGDHYPTRSTLMGIPVDQAAPVTLSKKQVRQLSEWIRQSEIICPDGTIYFHPTTVSLENLMMAHPCEIARLHETIPAQKRLPKHFSKPAEHAEEVAQIQVLLMSVVVPNDQNSCWDWESFDDERQADFARAASDVLFDGRAVATPPILLSEIISGDIEDDEDQPDPEDEFSEALMSVILDLGTSELDAEIDESDDESLEITLCDAEENCRRLHVEYGSVGLSRSEAFMMVYDVMKRAGVLGIMLNEELDDLDLPNDFPPDDVVIH
ncbi:hypothetical protein HAP94_14660 [Acidithiobacillus ferrivorans]|nr:hypothetical protein [Acidithiobacillus ferrivorans]